MAKSRTNQTAQVAKPAPKEEVVETEVKPTDTQEVTGVEEKAPEAEVIEAEQPAEVKEAPAVPEEVPAPEAPVLEEPESEPELSEGNYLSLPKEIRDAQASQEIIHTPTGQRIQPPMNPFMKMEAERVAKQNESSVPTDVQMIALLKDKLNIDITANYVLSATVSRLNKYVVEMAPNVPVSPDMGANYQRELANSIFEALSASPDVSLATLKVIEEYFRQYNGHAMAQSHVYRYMDMVRLGQTDLQAFQALLHMFIELANPDNQTRREIQRKVNLTRMAELMPGNTDAQARLVEFLS